MKSFPLETLIALAIVLFSAAVSTVNGCTCGTVSPCEHYAGASVAFVGVALKSTFQTRQSRVPPLAMSTTFTRTVPVTRFKVEEVFAGVQDKEIDISGGGTTCDFAFKEAERYLVYAVQVEGETTFFTSICSGTALLSEAKDDLDYLRKVVKLPTGATFLGEITRQVPRDGNREPSFVPVRGVVVMLENGGQKFQAVTGADGKFELRNLPQGRYKVHTEPATNASHLDVSTNEPKTEWEVETPSHGCIQTWFADRPAGEISGVVVDSAGVVANDVEPELMPVDGSIDSIRTSNLGEFSAFRFTFLPSGRYYLGFNLTSGPSLIEPYPEFYYPGVTDRSKATIITITNGQKLTGLYLKRPNRLAERTIEGVAVWPDGRPFVANCGIELTNPRTGYREGNCVSPDEQGHFAIKAVEGQTYELRASINGPLIRSKPIMLTVKHENPVVRFVVVRQ